MNRRWGRCMVIGAIALMPIILAGQTDASEKRITLKEAVNNQFQIGAAITSRQLDDPAHVALILDQFNCLTGEYEFFPLFLQPSPGTFTFGPADRIVAFAQEHRLPFRKTSKSSSSSLMATSCRVIEAIPTRTACPMLSISSFPNDMWSCFQFSRGIATSSRALHFGGS